MKLRRDKTRYQIVVYNDDGTVALITKNSKIARDYMKYKKIRIGYNKEDDKK